MVQVKNKVLLKKIALCIKELRKSKGITLDAFFVDTGIHLGRIEQGKTNMSISTLSSICTYFDISLKVFFEKLERF